MIKRHLTSKLNILDCLYTVAFIVTEKFWEDNELYQIRRIHSSIKHSDEGIFSMNVPNMQGLIHNANVILGNSVLSATRHLIITKHQIYNRTHVTHKLAAIY